MLALPNRWKSTDNDILDWLIKYKINGMNCAAYLGHLKIVKFLHENKREGCTKQAMQ
jgi:hypothetical protein